jgi:hypothetical protein
MFEAIIEQNKAIMDKNQQLSGKLGAQQVAISQLGAQQAAILQQLDTAPSKGNRRRMRAFPLRCGKGDNYP